MTHDDTWWHMMTHGNLSCNYVYDRSYLGCTCCLHLFLHGRVIWRNSCYWPFSLATCVLWLLNCAELRTDASSWGYFKTCYYMCTRFLARANLLEQWKVFTWSFNKQKATASSDGWVPHPARVACRDCTESSTVTYEPLRMNGVESTECRLTYTYCKRYITDRFSLELLQCHDK
jgi:hypothetical protein